MNVYKIHEWNPIMIDGNNYPCVYILPDLQLSNLLKIYKELPVNVKITNSNSHYDNNNYSGICKLSENVFCYRPNFQLKTNYVAVIIKERWESYPLSDGEISIDLSRYTLTNPTPKHDLMYQYEKSNYKMYLMIIAIIILSISLYLLHN